MFWIVGAGTALASVPPPSSDLLRAEIRSRKNPSFDSLLKRWNMLYGPQAVGPLIQVAKNRKLPDPDRYVALMGAAKLGGSGIAPSLCPFLKDSSWMIRSAALRALGALQNIGTASSVLPLLRDPALVVRAEAVEVVKLLQPPGAIDALVATLARQENYHRGKAQWVPQRVLAALISLKAKEAVSRLRPLLDHQLDPELQKLTIRTLEKLTGRSFSKAQTLKEQVQSWKIALRD